jgi:hypothetical protein
MRRQLRSWWADGYAQRVKRSLEVAEPAEGQFRLRLRGDWAVSVGAVREVDAGERMTREGEYKQPQKRGVILIALDAP